MNATFSSSRCVSSCGSKSLVRALLQGSVNYPVSYLEANLVSLVAYKFVRLLN